jgi:hypothetical protein
MGKIIWLASYPKSGNTWLRAFLHNYLRNPKESYDVNKMSDFSLGDSTGFLYQKFLRKPVKEMTGEEIALLRPKVQELLTRALPDNVFIKTHNALLDHYDQPMIHMEYTAGAVYVVRNPLDMVISHADHYGHTIDETIHIISEGEAVVVSGEENVYEIHGSWSRHVESWTGRPHRALHLMRYEDMLARPAETFGGLVQFLHLPEEKERLRRSIELSSFDSLRKMEEEKGFIERSKSQKRFFRQGKAGGWRDVLSRAQVEAIVAAHEPQMRRFGYWPVADWAAVSAPAAANA